MEKDETWWAELQPTLIILGVIGAVSGFTWLGIDPALQSILPLEEWSLGMKAVHYMSQVIFICSILLVLGLVTDAYDGLLYKYFTHRKVVIALAFWGCVLTLIFLFWMPGHFVDELQVLSGNTR